MKKPIEMGKQYRTEDGREVRIYAVDGYKPYPIHGAIKFSDGFGTAYWTEHGENAATPNYSLIEIKPKRKIEFWVNVYPDWGTECHSTKADADGCAASNRLACLHFIREYEEGEGL